MSTTNELQGLLNLKIDRETVDGIAGDDSSPTTESSPPQDSYPHFEPGPSKSGYELSGTQKNRSIASRRWKTETVSRRRRPAATTPTVVHGYKPHSSVALPREGASTNGKEHPVIPRQHHQQQQKRMTTVSVMEESIANGNVHEAEGDDSTEGELAG